MTKNIGILSSHNGSGFEAILKAINEKELNANITVVISNNTNAKVLQIAKDANIPNFLINKNNTQEEQIDLKIEELLKEHKCDYIFLSGYMKKLSPSLIKAYPKNIINSHPSLLPKYGGKGMYGSFVHEAVVQNKEKNTGVTIHFVDEVYDEGEIILQNSIELAADETSAEVEQRVKSIEKPTIIEAFKKLIN